MVSLKQPRVSQVSLGVYLFINQGFPGVRLAAFYVLIR